VSPAKALLAIKILHTLIWAFLAACVLSLPIFAWSGRFDLCLLTSGIVVAECGILAANRGRCPLTDMASRHTRDRAANFDIFLPPWVARHNKAIFGMLFVAGEMFTLWRWLQ